MWGCVDFCSPMSFFGPSFGCMPYMGGMWGCSNMFMGPSMFFNPMPFYGGFAGSMIGSGIGGALGYFAAGGSHNPWMGMTGAIVGSSLGSSLGWLAGSFGF